MREPIKPEDIREGDLVRREPLDTRSLRAVEYVALKDGYTHGLSDSERDVFYLLDRPTPAVDLPTDEALGWATVRAPHWTSDTVLLRHWEVEGSHLRCAVAPMYLVDYITSFTPAVAVPKAALDELRRDHSADLFEIDLDTAVVKFLAAIDAANGDPR